MRRENLCATRFQQWSNFSTRTPVGKNNRSDPTPVGGAPSCLISIDGTFWFKPVYGVSNPSHVPIGTMHSVPFVPED